jgi:sugar-specific transcriptional regulator TrmB
MFATPKRGSIYIPVALPCIKMQATLCDLGLSRKESICYIALLELGSSKAGEIVKKTSIPSSRIYETLHKLIGRGLVSYVIKKNVKRYQASDPNSLLNYIQEKKDKVESILPQLLAKQNASKKQSVELYEGQKAIFTLFSNLVSDAKPGEMYLVFSINEENKTEQANLFFKNLSVRRKAKQLDVRLLKHIGYYIKEKHTKLKLKYTKLNLPQGITVFRDYVILLSWQTNPIAIKIQSEAFAHQQRQFFFDLWKHAKT